MEAFRALLPVTNQGACAPAMTMYSRNELVHYAMQTLTGEARATFLQYADVLAAALPDCSDITFPPPPAVPHKPRGPAKTCAWHHLQQGAGNLWTAIRSTISLLDFEDDPRPHARGMTLVLGAYCKGGIVGTSRATAAHPATCLLLNTAVIKVASKHQWTSLAINVDNQTEPHVDRHNGDTPSLLLGVSHHTAGDLWTATPNGRFSMEISNRLIAGTTHPTSAAAVLFDGRNVCHATCPWSGGNRITTVAYTVQRTQHLPPDTAEYLENLGFVLPR